jgi:hypothetical protein
LWFIFTLLGAHKVPGGQARAAWGTMQYAKLKPGMAAGESRYCFPASFCSSSLLIEIFQNHH